MKYLKIIGLAMMAAGASLAFANTASATVLTSPSGTEYTSSFKASATGSLLLKAGFAEITCTASSVGGTVESNTTVSRGNTAEGSFTSCGSSTVDILSGGSLEVSSGGSVKAVGGEVTVSALGTSCVYGGGTGTTLGTLTGGTTAKLTIKAQLPKISGGFLCASPAEWTGNYSVTTPDTLLVD
jgi:hypothetical protein